MGRGPGFVPSSGFYCRDEWVDRYLHRDQDKAWWLLGTGGRHQGTLGPGGRHPVLSILCSQENGLDRKVQELRETPCGEFCALQVRLFLSFVYVHAYLVRVSVSSSPFVFSTPLSSFFSSSFPSRPSSVSSLPLLLSLPNLLLPLPRLLLPILSLFQVMED